MQPVNRLLLICDRVGHVFQGRFKSIIVEKDSYLLELARYIVLNPVRARMVRLAKNWPWSSCGATAGLPNSPGDLNVGWLLSQFAVRKSAAIKRYEAFVSEGKNKPSPWESLRNQVFLGSDAFIEEVKSHIPDDKDLREIPQLQKRPLAKRLTYFKESYGNRDVVIVKAFESGGYRMKEIGDYFDLHYSTVSRIVKRAGNARDKT